MAIKSAIQLPREELLRGYSCMRRIREFEERIHTEFSTGEIPGFVHLYSGQEASAAGVMMHLGDSDLIASTHRGHGHCVAKGCDIGAMMKEIYGKRGGLCSGKGGSMHIADLEKGMMGANGIVGGGPPLVCGAALAAKVKKTGAVAVAFLGDGASNQGTTLESYNLASVLKLPAIFVIEDNGYAESTSSSWSVGGSQLGRAEGFGMVGREVDGHDFFDVWEAAGWAVQHARDGNGPALLHVKTHRYYGHFEGDASSYRAPDEVARLRAERDCLKLFRNRVVESGLLETEQLDAIDRDALQLIDSAVADAKSDKPPRITDLLTHVYANY